MTKRDDQKLESGAEIGVYEIKSVCFADRFSITYRALNHHMNQLVALTEYLPEDFALRKRNSTVVEAKSDSRDTKYQKGLAKFIEIADALVQVQHENVLAVHNVLPFNDTAYLVTDYIGDNCISIDDGCAENELTDRLVALLGGLEYLHQQGIIHGGICPKAIFQNKHGDVMLGRFAVARLATETANGPSENELPAAYAAIEQYDAASRVGAATDLYGLGGVFYAYLNHSDPVTSRLRLKAVRKNEPDPLPRIAGSEDAGDGPGWVNVVESMLSIKQSDRPQSAAAVLAELYTGLADTHSQSGEVTQGIAGGAAQALSDWSARRWAASIAVFALLGLFGLWISQDRDNRSSIESAAIQKQSKSPLVAQNSIGRSPAQVPDQSQASSFSALEITGGVAPQSIPMDSGVEVEADAGSDQSGDVVAKLNAVDSSTDEGYGPPERTEPIKIASESVSDIKWHLDEAQKDFRALRLTTPQGKNAYEHYAAVLTLESDNKDALEGQERIVDMYIWLIGNAIQQERRKLAGVYMARAERMAPHNPSLLSLREDLTSMDVN